MHLLNKCETCNKNRRESTAVTKFREALSFSAFLVIFFAFAKSDIIATAIVILKPWASVIFYSPPKLAKRIPLGASRISLRSNITRHRRIELAIKTEERGTRLQNSVKLSLLCFLVIFFALAKSDIIAPAIVILKPCGFSGILFAHRP